MLDLTFFGRVFHTFFFVLLSFHKKEKCLIANINACNVRTVRYYVIDICLRLS